MSERELLTKLAEWGGLRARASVSGRGYLDRMKRVDKTSNIDTCSVTL